MWCTLTAEQSWNQPHRMEDCSRQASEKVILLLDLHSRVKFFEFIKVFLKFTLPKVFPKPIEVSENEAMEAAQFGNMDSRIPTMEEADAASAAPSKDLKNSLIKKSIPTSTCAHYTTEGRINQETVSCSGYMIGSQRECHKFLIPASPCCRAL